MTTIDTEIHLDRVVKIALYEAHQGRCFYTGRHLPIENMEIDHIKPRRSNGVDCLANVVLADRAINRLKSDREDGELVERMLYINRTVFAPRALACLSGKLSTRVSTPEIQKSCDECGIVFITKRLNKRFCSDLCRVQAWQKRFPRIDPTTGDLKQSGKESK